MSGTDVEEAWRTTHEPSRCSVFFSGEKCSIPVTSRSPTTMSARPSRIGAHELRDVGAVVLVVGVGVDDHVGAELQRRVDAGLEAGREALVVGQAHEVVDAVRARDRDRLVGRAVVDHEPLDDVEARRPRAGRSASVCGSCSASLKQGIWMMSFIGDDCLDLAPGSIPKRRPRSWRWARGRRRRRLAAGRGSMESATLTRRATGLDPAGAAARRARARRGRRSRFAVLCVGALIGYFAFPTYPTYDSFYALLWGRDLLHLHLPDFRVYRGPTEHPLAIAFGDVLLDLRPGRRAPDGARLDRLVRRARRRRSTGSGGCASARSSGVVAALLVLSRFFVENLAAQGYLDISYVALIVWAVVLEVEAPAARRAGARRCSPPPGCCAPTRGC